MKPKYEVDVIDYAENFAGIYALELLEVVVDDGAVSTIVAFRDPQYRQTIYHRAFNTFRAARSYFNYMVTNEDRIGGTDQYFEISREYFAQRANNKED